MTLFDAEDLRREPCPTCTGRGTVPCQEELAEALRERRAEARVAMREVARRMGISPGYLSRLETAHERWSRALVVRYEAALETPE